MADPRTNRLGMTLVELMVAMSILVIVMGVLFTLSLSIGDTARVHDVKITAMDEGQRALIRIAPRLRQAQRSSLNLEEMPCDVLRFQMPADVDNNGVAVDASNQLELGEPITVRRDTTDQNNDGLSTTQLIMIEGETITVLANYVSPDDAPPPDEEEDGESPPENRAGFWVDTIDNSIQVTIRTQGTSRRGHVIRQEFSQRIEPRN